MMRVPLPVIFAALVVAAAGSVLVNLYFKADKAYVLDVSDLQLNQSKTIELNYIPAKIIIKSNNTNALYEVHIYVDGTFRVDTNILERVSGVVFENEYYDYVYNGTIFEIKPIDIRTTHVKIVVRYVYNGGL